MEDIIPVPLWWSRIRHTSIGPSVWIADEDLLKRCLST